MYFTTVVNNNTCGGFLGGILVARSSQSRTMDIATSLTYHITKTGNILRRLAARKIRDAGLDITPEESVLLNQLWDRDQQSQTELGQWSVKERSTVTRQIDSLVSKGYVERRQRPDDRRSVCIALTVKGKALEARFEHTGIRQLDEDLAQALTGGSGEMLEQLIKVRERALAELRDG